MLPLHDPAPLRILLIAEARPSAQRYLQMLTAPPSVLGSSYLLVAAGPADLLLEPADEQFDLAIIDLAPGAHDALAAYLSRQLTRCGVLLVGAVAPPAGAALLIGRPVQASELRAAVARLLRGGGEPSALRPT